LRAAANCSGVSSSRCANNHWIASVPERISAPGSGTSTPGSGATAIANACRAVSTSTTPSGPIRLSTCCHADSGGPLDFTGASGCAGSGPVCPAEQPARSIAATAARPIARHILSNMDR
jgi:hypothetical protein